MTDITTEETHFNHLVSGANFGIEVAPVKDLKNVVLHEFNTTDDLFPNSPKQFLNLTTQKIVNNLQIKTIDKINENIADNLAPNLLAASMETTATLGQVEQLPIEVNSNHIKNEIKNENNSIDFNNQQNSNEQQLTNDQFKTDTITVLHSNTFSNESIDQDGSKEEILDRIKITLPSASPSGHSSCSSSSESNSFSTNGAKKSKRRYCRTCDILFRKSSELNQHLRTHVSMPSICIKKVEVDEDQRDVFKDYLIRLRDSAKAIYARKKTTDVDSGGLKLKLKLSGTQNFEVVTPKEEHSSQPKCLRILTAKEIKLSPTSSPRQASPLDAMVALSEMTFNNDNDFMHSSEQDKVHFECPALDGLDQFNDNSKDSAAELLKQLLESPQEPSENDWSAAAPSNEYISIDRLAHICTVCHSNFPDAVMLYEHKRITGHDFTNALDNSRLHQNHQQQMHQQHQQQLHHQQQQMMMQRQYLRPRSQAQLTGPSAGYGQPQVGPPQHLQVNRGLYPPHMQQPDNGGGPSRFAGPLRPPYLPHQQQQHPQQQQPQLQPRRTPPPLYRPNPNNSSNQPINMAPFMSMSPDMYNPPANGSSSAYGSQAAQQRGSPQQRISPHPQNALSHQQQQQQQQQQHQFNQQQQQLHHQQQMRPPQMQMLRTMRPPPGSPQAMLGMRQGILYNGIRRPQLMNMAQRMPQPPNNNFPQRQPNPNYPPQLAVRTRFLPPPAKKMKLADDDCQLISMQPRSNGLPVIQSVQGGASANTESETNGTRKLNDSTIQLSDQITLSVKAKDNQLQNKNPKDVANILAHRGITVTPTAKLLEPKVSNDNNQDDESQAVTNPSGSSSTDEAVQKIQLNSSVSIISKKKTQTIDLSNDDDEKDEMPPPVAPPSQRPLFLCPSNYCRERFLSQDSLTRHMQRSHKPSHLRIHRCRLCPAKFSTIEGLSFHSKKVHRIFKTTADELGLPIVDLRNEQTKAKLASIGIVNYIPLGNLSKSGGGIYGLPIVSVQGAANSAICNLSALGADSLLSLGPVKQIPKHS